MFAPKTNRSRKRRLDSLSLVNKGHFGGLAFFTHVVTSMSGYPGPESPPLACPLPGSPWRVADPEGSGGSVVLLHSELPPWVAFPPIRNLKNGQRCEGTTSSPMEITDIFKPRYRRCKWIKIPCLLVAP